jgi:peroxiredoxin Q/BCP
LRHDYDEFVKRGAEIIAVGPERVNAFSAWWREHRMPYVGLSDRKHNVARLYGQQVKILKLGRMPAQMIIDRSGRIRYVHYGTSMADLPENSDTLAKIDELNRE